MKKYIKYPKLSPDSKLFRLGLLCVAGLLGAHVYGNWLPKIHSFLGVEGTKNSIHVDGVVLGLAVFLALWIFRTRDVRQNIEQTNLFNGLRLLASDNPLEIDIGVYQLLRLADAVPEYNPDIRLAFIRRLKQLPTNLPEIPRHPDPDIDYQKLDEAQISNIVPLAYAQHIFKWLMKNKQKNDKSDYTNIDISYQDFSELGSFPEIQDNYKTILFGSEPVVRTVIQTWIIWDVGVCASDLQDVKKNHHNILGKKAIDSYYRPIF